jgi:hypothetical protein
MALLEWENELGALAIALSKGEIRILLRAARLALPPLGEGRPVERLPCSVLVTAGGDDGLRVEGQGASSMTLVGHTLGAGARNDHVYVLSGTDSDGARWRIRDNRMLINCRLQTNSASYWLHPNFTDVTSTVFPEGLRDSIEIAVPKSVQLPDYSVNHDTGERERVQNEQFGVLIHGDVQIRQRVVGEYRVITMRRFANMAPMTQAYRLLDAISFVNGYQIWPSLIRRLENGKAVLSIFRKRSDWDSDNRFPPLEFGSDRARLLTWNAIEAYFRFVAPVSKAKRPQLSMSVSQLQGAYRSLFLSNRALAAAVAVEGLISAFVMQGIVPVWTANKRARWSRWVDEAGLPEEVELTFKNAIGRRGSRSTSALLRALEARGVVTAEDSRTWREQRPRLAHALHDTNNDLASLTASVSIFHSIALSLIGFVGEFRGYGPQGSKLANSAQTPAETFRRSVR